MSTSTSKPSFSQPSLVARRRTAVSNKRKPFKAKVVVVGDAGVGKTSILLRYDGQGFSPRMSSTLGASFVSSKSNYNGREVELQIWDTAGQERFRSMVPMYLRNSLACILVFDLTDRQSFYNISSWIKEIERSDCQPVALFIMANKADLEGKRSVEQAEGEQFAASHNAYYFETSALTGKGIETAMVRIAEEVLRRIEQVGLDQQSIYLHAVSHKQSGANQQEEEEKGSKLCRCTIL